MRRLDGSLIGSKNNKDLFDNLLGPLLPESIKLYVEPFGGEFGLYELLDPKPTIAVYNDVNFELYNIVSKKYDDVICFNEDYKEIIHRYNNTETFLYVDPPYYKKEKYYENHDFLTDRDHAELSNILKDFKGKFLLSYIKNDFISALYNDYKFFEYQGKSKMHKTEIAIKNY